MEKGWFRPTVTSQHLARQIQFHLDVLGHRSGQSFPEPSGRHRGVPHLELDLPRKLSNKFTAGELCGSYSIDGLTILEEEAKMQGQL